MRLPEEVSKKRRGYVNPFAEGSRFIKVLRDETDSAQALCGVSDQVPP
jgi:hypothetical protein